MQVFVRDNDVNSALRVLKKKIQREDAFHEVKQRAYEKPSEPRVREKAEAVRRHRKMMRKHLEREAPRSIKASAGTCRRWHRVQSVAIWHQKKAGIPKGASCGRGGREF